MLNLLLQKFSMPRLLDRLWRTLRETPIAEFIAHRSQVVPAAYLLQGDRRYALACAELLFREPLRGAGSGWESKMPLPADVSGTSPVVTTGANVLNLNVPDFCEVLRIQFAWQVAGTVTALVMDFDSYSGPNGAGSLVLDKLDGTNGVITAPTVAGQAIGNVLYKDIGNTLFIALNAGTSVQAIVTTTTTAGSGLPAVIVIPKAETMLNYGAAAILSA